MSRHIPNSLVFSLTSLLGPSSSRFPSQEVSISSSPGSLSVLLSPSPSFFQLHFLSKQFLSHFYHLSPSQLRSAFRFSSRSQLPLLSVLESRLDVAIFRLGFARSLPHARSLIKSGAILVNHSPVFFPDFILSSGSLISSSSPLSLSSSLFSLIRSSS